MPSHHKRHTPSRAPNGPIADAAAPAEIANPDQAAQPAPPLATPESQAAPTSPPPSPPPSQLQSQPPAQQQPQQQPQQQRRAGQGLNITDLKDMSIQKLTQIAKDLTVV